MSKSEMTNEKIKQVYLLSIITIILLIATSIYNSYLHFSFILNSEKIEGTLHEIVYKEVHDRYNPIRHRYYGVYNYYDENNKLKQITSEGFNMSENSVPKSAIIYYNSKLDQAKVKNRLVWIINESPIAIVLFISALSPIGYIKKRDETELYQQIKKDK